jgi:hypothetical protein
MSKSLRAPVRKQQRKAVARFTSNDKWRFLGVFLFLVVAWITFWSLNRASSRKEVDRSIPPFMEAGTAAGALPATLAPAQFTDPSIKEAYVVALKIPQILAQQPCYCGCSNIGHHSLLDCYRSSHAADCIICVKEAILASRMHDAGKTVREIRAAIVAGEWSHVR